MDCSISFVRGVGEPERSRAAFRHLVFSRNSRSVTYCQISWNNLYYAFRHLFVTVQKGSFKISQRKKIFGKS